MAMRTEWYHPALFGCLSDFEPASLFVRWREYARPETFSCLRVDKDGFQHLLLGVPLPRSLLTTAQRLQELSHHGRFVDGLHPKVTEVTHRHHHLHVSLRATAKSDDDCILPAITPLRRENPDLRTRSKVAEAFTDLLAPWPMASLLGHIGHDGPAKNIVLGSILLCHRPSMVRPWPGRRIDSATDEVLGAALT